MADNPNNKPVFSSWDRSLDSRSPEVRQLQDWALEKKLGAELDEYSEIYVMTLQEGMEIARLQEAEAFGNFPRRGDAGQATGGFQWRESPLTVWQNTVGGPAGSPIGAGAMDVKNLQRIYKIFHGPGWKSYTMKVTKAGTPVLVIKGKNGLRNPPWKHAYNKLTDPHVIEMGIGVRGLAKSSVEGMKVGFYVSGAIETLDFIFDDEKTVIDLFGGLIVEGGKAVVASLLGLAIGAGVATVAGLAITPIAVMAVAVFVVGIGLNLLDDRLGIKTGFVAWLKELFGLQADKLADVTHSGWQINTDSPEWKAYVRQERQAKIREEAERMTHWGPNGASRPLWLKPI